MWSRSIFASILSKSYEKVVIDLPSDINNYIYNGDHIMTLTAVQLLPDENSAVPTIEKIKLGIDMNIHRDKNCFVLYSVDPTLYCRYGAAQKDLPRYVKRLYIPGREEHTKYVEKYSATKGDFIYKLQRLLSVIEGNVVIIDDDDTTLLSLLYRQKKDRLNMYYTNDLNMKRCIDVAQLRQSIHMLTGNFSRSGFGDALFVMPLCLHTIIPNVVSFQTSLRPDNILELLRNMRNARGTIYEEEVEAINIGALFRYIKELAADEIKSTGELMALLHTRKCKKPYNPTMVDLKSYKEVYYNGIIDDEKFKRYIASYISALIEASKYLKGEKAVIEHIFAEAPLLSDIASMLQEIEEKEIIRATVAPWRSEVSRIRHLNRYPPIYPVEYE